MELRRRIMEKRNILMGKYLRAVGVSVGVWCSWRTRSVRALQADSPRVSVRAGVRALQTGSSCVSLFLTSCVRSDQVRFESQRVQATCTSSRIVSIKE